LVEKLLEHKVPKEPSIPENVDINWLEEYPKSVIPNLQEGVSKIFDKPFDLVLNNKFFKLYM